MLAAHWSTDRFPISEGRSWLVELLATDSLAILGQARVFPDSTLHTPGPAAGTGNITLTVEGLVRERAEGWLQLLQIIYNPTIKTSIFIASCSNQALQVRLSCYWAAHSQGAEWGADNSHSSC